MHVSRTSNFPKNKHFLPQFKKCEKFTSARFSFLTFKPKNFSKFTRKHFSWSLAFYKLHVEKIRKIQMKIPVLESCLK